MGRNSKKNKGRTPATEQGLKGAASLASSSANVATAPSRPARTAKHKVRKFPSQATTVTSIQADDSHSARGLKEIQPLSAPPNTVKHETLPSGPSTTPTSKSPRTCAAIITEPAATVSSSNEKEIPLHQPNLSDSYDSMSASSSETETCMQEDVNQISNIDNVPEIQRIETTQQPQEVSVLQETDEKSKGLVEEEYAGTLLVATKNKEVPQRADSSGHTSGLLANPSVAEQLTSFSPSLHNQLEAKVSELFTENASRAQTDEEIISFQENAKETNDSPLQAFHPDKHDQVREVLSSSIETERTKQTASDDRSSGPAVAGGKEDSSLVNAESGVSKRSSSGSQSSLIDPLVTTSKSPGNLQQKYGAEKELETLLESFDKGLEEDKDHIPAEKKNNTANSTEEIDSTRILSAHQILLSAAAHHVVEESLKKNDLTKDKNEESRQVNLCCIEEAPLCSTDFPIEELEAGKAEEATAVEEQPKYDEKLSQLDDMRKRKPQVEVLESESAILKENECQKEMPDHVDSGYVCKEETNSAGNRQQKELEIDYAALYEESPEEKPDQLNRRAECEGRVINSVDSEKDKGEVGGSEVKDSSLNKEDYRQEKPDHDHEAAVCPSVFQVQKIIQTPEVETEELNVGEPPEGYVTLAVEYTTSKFDVGEPLAGGVKDQDSPEKKFDRQLDGGTRCEEQATNSIESVMEQESEADLLTLNKEECQEEKTDQTQIGFYCKEHETKFLENVEKFDSQGEEVTLYQACQGEKPDQVDSDTVCQEHNRSFENEIEKLEVEEMGIAKVIEEKKESQERHSTRSLEEEKMKQSMQEVESDTLEEKKDGIEETPGHVDGGNVDTENLEDQNERGIASQENAEPSVNIEVGKIEVETPEVAPKVTVDKEECQEDTKDEADVGSACEEPKTQFLEDALEKPDLEEPQVGVMLDKNQKLGAETSAQVDSDSVCQEQKAITTVDKKECEDEHATTILLENEMEQPKAEVEIVTLEESPERMPYQTDSGHMFKDQDMHSVKNMPENPEVAEIEVEGLALQREKEIKEELDQLTLIEGYAKTCVDRDKENLEGGTPEVALNKDECKEEKHYQNTDIFLCEEHQQLDLEHVKEKPVMVEPQVQGVKLDKEQKLQKDEPDQVNSDSGSREHPTSYSTGNENEHPKRYSTENENEYPANYSTENENEVRELETGIALEEEKQLQEEHTNKYVENDTERLKPQVESAPPEEKKESPSEMQDQIDSGHVGKEHKMHSVENELEKPEVEEADMEIVGLYKKKDSQEDEPGQLEGGTLWKKDANDSIETETAKLAAKNPDPNSTDREEVEEGKHQQDQKNALETSSQEEAQLDKERGEEEKHQQDDNGYVYVEKRERGLCEDALETSNLEEPQVENLILAKGPKDCQENHPTKSVDHEVEQPELEVEIVLEEKKENPDGKPDQIDRSCASEEYKLHSPVKKLEKIELGQPEVESSTVQGIKECQEQDFKQLEKGTVCEGDAKNSIESETEMLEARKPEGKSTALQEECEDRKDGQADGGCVSEEHQVTDFLEHAMEKRELRETQVVGGMLGENQEPPEEKSDRVGRDTVCQEHPLDSVLENLDVGESQIAIAGMEEEHTISSMETGMQQPNPEVGSTPLEEKKESPEQMHDRIEGSNMNEDHKMPSGANELENIKMGEPQVESVSLQQKQESQEDQLEQLDWGPVHTENSLENEGRKPEINSTALDKEESKEGKNDQADSGSACEKHQLTQFLEHTVEKPDVEEAQGGEGASLEKEKELPEKNFDQTDNDCACKDDTESAFEKKIEEIEVDEPEAIIALCKEKGYIEEQPYQLNTSDQHSMSPDENTKEKPEVKEPEIAHHKKTQEYQEETSEQVESDYVCNEHDTESVDVSEMEETELKNLLVCQKNEGKEGKANEVSSSSPNEDLITDSVQRDLERLEVAEGRAGLALEENENWQPNQADPTSSVCNEQAPKSVARELELVELEQPEQGVAVGDKLECQDVTLNQKNESKEGEADKVSDSSPIEQLITDSAKQDMERLEMGVTQVGLAHEEMDDCQPDYANICEKEAQKPVANELRLVELEEPEAGAVAVQKMEYQEEEPGQVHKDQLSQEENPANLETCCQNTTSILKGKTDKFVLEEPEKLAVVFETMDCQNESYQLHKEPVTEEHNINCAANEVETLKMREPEGNVKLDGENECQEEIPAAVKKVPQGQEQTTSSLNIEMEELEVKDPEATFKEDKDPQDDKPSQLDIDSACEEQDMREKTNPTDHLEREPEACGVMLDEVQGCHGDKSNQIGSHSECGKHPAISVEHETETLEMGGEQEERSEKEEGQENSDQLSIDFVCEDSEKENLDTKDLEVDNVQLRDEELQEKKPHKVCDGSQGEQYTARSEENIENVEAEHTAFEEATPSIVYAKQGAKFAENKVKVEVQEIELVQLGKTEDENEKPVQIMDGSISEKDSTDLKLQVSQSEQGGDVALDERKEFHEEITDAVDNGSGCETEKPEAEVVPTEGNGESHGGKNHEQADDNSCVSEAQMIESANNEGGKHEVRVPEGEDLLDKMEHQSKEPDLADSNTASEEHATNSKDDNTERFEMYHPEVEKPQQVNFNSPASEEHTVENESEKAEVKVPEVEDTTPDQAGSSSICEEHDMDKLEVNQSEVGVPQEVTISRYVSIQHIVDFLERQVDGPKVEDNLLDGKESRSDRPNPDECSCVCGEPMTDSGEDRTDGPDVNQPKVENLEEVIVDTTSVNEAHKLDSLKNETESSEVGVLQVEDDVLDEKESQSEKPEQNENNSVCEENATNFPEYEEGKLKLNLPHSNEVNSNTPSVYEAHMLNPHDNETKKPEGVLEVGDIVLEPKECLGNKRHQDDSEVHTTNSKEEDINKLEVNLPEEEKSDHNIADVSVLEAPTKHSLPNEMKKPDERVPEEEDNAPEQTKCSLSDKTEQDESGSAHEEHATGSKKNDTDKPEVGEPDECITLRSVSETNTLDSLKPEEGAPKLKDNMLEQECLGKKPDKDGSSSALEEHAIDCKEDDIEKREEGVPKVEDNKLEQKEYFGEKPEQDDSSSVLEEHTTESKAGGRDGLEEVQPKVDTPNHLIASSTAVNETHTPDSLMGETEKPREQVLDIEDNVLMLKESLGPKTEQDENSSLCEEHVADPKEDMDKLEVNQPEIGESHWISAEITPVIGIYKLDSQETKTEKNEESPEVKDNVPEEEVCEKPHQDASDSIFEEHATDSKEDDMDKLKVTLLQYDQDNLLLEKECLDEKTEQDENCSVCESTGDKLEVCLPELDQVITRGTSLSELALNSLKNETEGSEVKVPEVKDDGFRDPNLQAVELSDLPAEDKKNREFEQESGNTKNAYDQLHDPSSREEERHMEVKDLPAMSKSKTEEIELRQITEISNALTLQEGTQKIVEQLDAAKPEEAEQEPMHHLQSWEEDQDVHQIEESSLSQATQKYESKKGDAAKLLKSISPAQEEDSLNLTTDGQEVRAKEIRPHSDAKERFLDINELEDEKREQHGPQSVLEQQESPAENEKAYDIQQVSAKQSQSDNVELSCERDVNTTLETDQTESNEQQSGQKEARKDVADLAVHEGQPNFKIENQECISDDSNKMVSEVRNVSEESESHTTSEIDASMNKQINAVWMPDGDTESKTQPNDDQNSPEHVNLHLQENHTQEGQKVLAGIDDVNDDFQRVKKTSAAPKMQEGNFDLEETAPVCIPQSINVALLESKSEPSKEECVKQQHDEQKPKNLEVKAEDATDNELTCNLNIPILTSEEGLKQAFQSVPFPVMTCSSPSNLLPLPL